MAKFSAERCTARALALEEAADHLRLAWTDVDMEYEEGQKVADQLNAEAAKWRDRAHDRSAP